MTITNRRHTPGPWITNGTMVIQDTGPKPAWPIAGLETEVPEWRANQRLIAAAPELLQVLEAVLEQGHIDIDDVNTGYNMSLREMARAAISKARAEA